MYEVDVVMKITLKVDKKFNPKDNSLRVMIEEEILNPIDDKYLDFQNEKDEDVSCNMISFEVVKIQ